MPASLAVWVRGAFALVLATCAPLIGAGQALPPAAPILASRSITGAPGNAASNSPALSADGLCVAFQSAGSDLVPADTNEAVDVFLRLLPGGPTERVSVPDFASQGNGHSFEPAVSGDCRYVAFTSIASNLVPGDTNGTADVFVQDRLQRRVTRISQLPGGGQMTMGSSSPSISLDGRYVAFDTAYVPFVSGSRIYLYDSATGETSEIPGPPGINTWQPVLSGDGRFVAFTSYLRQSVPGYLTDDRVWLYARETGQLRVVATATGSVPFPFFGRPAISHDGRFVAFTVASSGTSGRTVGPWAVHVYDRDTGETRAGEIAGVVNPPVRHPLMCSIRPCGSTSRPSIDATGRYLGLSQISPSATYQFDIYVVDRIAAVSAFLGSTKGTGTQMTANTREVSLAGDGLTVAFAADETAYAPEATTTTQVYVQTLDRDGDLMTDAWETAYSLGVTDPSDAGGDPDGDGLTNAAEHQAGTHPQGSFQRYLAEGASNAFFDLSLAIANPNAGPATVLLEFQRADGTEIRHYARIDAMSRVTLTAADVPGLNPAEFSTRLDADLPVAIDRTMTWDAGKYGGHAETGIVAPSLMWYLAEGATHSSFDLFYLLQNPSATDAEVEITYLLPAPASALSKSHVVAAHSRFNVWVDLEDPRLANVDVSAVIRSTNGVPILVERAMYAGVPGQVFAAGHASAGIPSPATEWYVAEGATGSFFDTFVLIANPGDVPALLDVKYLMPGGRTEVVHHQVAPRSRYTIWVDHESPALADTAVSTIVTATNGVPVVVERAMWWPGPTAATWYEAHAASGAPSAARRWVLAEGAAKPNDTAETFLLVANTSPGAAMARVTVFPDLGPALEKVYALAPESRTNVWINGEFSAQVLGRCWILVESDADIVVERATYWSAGGQVWAAGTAALGARLPKTTTSVP